MTLHTMFVSVIVQSVIPKLFLQYSVFYFYRYEDRLQVLNDCEYFRIFLDNLMKKCKEVNERYIVSLLCC